MTLVTRLYGAEIINRDLLFYKLKGVVSKEAHANLQITRNSLVKEIAPFTNDLLENNVNA